MFEVPGLRSYTAELEKTQWQGWLITSYCWSIVRKHHKQRQWGFLWRNGQSGQGTSILQYDCLGWGQDRYRHQPLLSFQCKVWSTSNTFSTQLQVTKWKVKVPTNQKELLSHPECSWTAGAHSCDLSYTVKCVDGVLKVTGWIPEIKFQKVTNWEDNTTKSMKHKTVRGCIIFWWNACSVLVLFP